MLVASFVIFLAGLIASLVISRIFSARVERLTEFSKRVAEGDFRPLAVEDSRDELAELGESLNESAQRLESQIHLLRGERNRSSAILRSMVEGVAVIDAHERLVFCNRAFSEILNIDSKSSEGRPLIEVVRNSELTSLIRKALKGEEGLQSDIATGIVQQQSFSVTAAPVKALESTSGASAPGASGPGASGQVSAAAPAEKPSGAVVVLHDVTELRRLERVRQDFVANVSHEFKTPLTAIQGFAETLLGGALEDPKNNRRFLEIMRDHAESRLARLTDDLLKLARIEAGKLEVRIFSRRRNRVCGALRGNRTAKSQPKTNHTRNRCPTRTSRGAGRCQLVARRASKPAGQRDPVHRTGRAHSRERQCRLARSRDHGFRYRHRNSGGRPGAHL